MRLSHFPIGTKIKTQYWPTDTWVEIRFIDRVGNYHCTDNHNNHVVHFENDDKTWQIWQEPKKKVIRWKWVYQTNGGWWESDAFYTEDEMNQVAYHFHEAKKLEYTATEFED